MKFLFAFLGFFLLLASSSIKAEVQQKSRFIFQVDTIIIPDSLNNSECAQLFNEIPTISTADLSDTSKPKNNKLVAAILSFPFPFGMLGLHRVYLGTKPYIPFVYIGTIGGCFLILPFIDFCTIVFSDDEMFRSFENNGKVFMWSH